MQYTQQQKRLFESLYKWVSDVLIHEEEEYPLPKGLDRDKLAVGAPNVHGTIITYDGEPIGIIKNEYGHPKGPNDPSPIISRQFKPITYELVFQPDSEVRIQGEAAKPTIDARELGRKLFSLHTHAELCKPEEIVYREADVINLLTSLGLPAPQFGE